jgi:hypothetical protein
VLGRPQDVFGDLPARLLNALVVTRKSPPLQPVVLLDQLRGEVGGQEPLVFRLERVMRAGRAHAPDPVKVLAISPASSKPFLFTFTRRC